MRSRLVVNGTLYREYYSGGQQYNVPRVMRILLWSHTVHCTCIVVRVTWYCVAVLPGPGTDTDQPWVHYEEGQTQPQQSGLHY